MPRIFALGFLVCLLVSLLVVVPFIQLQLHLALQSYKLFHDASRSMELHAIPQKNTMVFSSKGLPNDRNVTKPILAILVVTRSIKTWKRNQNTPLQQFLLPSLKQNVTSSEISKWDIRLYVAIDDDDHFWNDAARWMKLEIPSYLEVHVHMFPSMLNHISFNKIATVAYKDGAEYFCRISDDSSFSSQHWIEDAVLVLQNYEPPNVGVVVPTQDKSMVLSHDFVHRTHLEIFDGHYYPKELHSWYLDYWMTGIYSSHLLGKNFSRVTKLQNWTVDCHFMPKQYNDARPTERSILPDLFKAGLEQIQNHLKKYYPSQAPLLKAKMLNPQGAEIPENSEVDIDQVQAILKALPQNGNMLVWGLGHNSIYWYTMTQGNIAFILDKDSKRWEGVDQFLEVTTLHPYLEAYEVNYTARVSSGWKQFHGHPEVWEDKLYVHSFPKKLWEHHWDVILVDGPAGHSNKSPGYYQSLYTTFQLVQKQLACEKNGTVHVFVNDYDDRVERDFSREVFGRVPVNIVRQQQKPGKTATQQAHFIFEELNALLPVQRVGDSNDNSTMIFTATIQPQEKNATKPIMAILTASRSTKTWKANEKTPLEKLLLPSLYRTVTASEISKWDIRLYIAIDDDDQYWLDTAQWMGLQIPSFLTLHVHVFPRTVNHIPFNEIATVAYKDGAEYFCRINDDSAFLSQHWIEDAVRVLQNYKPPNVGVVGPICKQGNAGIMTHDFVHRTHLEIFDGCYYPKEFGNWYLDNWMTNIYSSRVLGKNFSRVTKLQTWEMIHHLMPTRYKPNHSDRNFLPNLYQEGLEQVRTYLNQTYPIQVSLLQAKVI